MRIVAVILAAGAGRRAGGPKALLAIDGHSFLAHVARGIARPGVDAVAAVLGHEAGRVEQESGLPAGVTRVLNPAPESGMLSSLLCGLDHAEQVGADAVLIHPVDHPTVAAGTIDRVIAALQAGAPIAVPSWQRRRGHPTGFARVTWRALRQAPADRGARAVLVDHPDWPVYVEGDPGCIAGVNTMEEYERLMRERS